MKQVGNCGMEKVMMNLNVTSEWLQYKRINLNIISILNFLAFREANLKTFGYLVVGEAHCRIRIKEWKR